MDDLLKEDMFMRRQRKLPMRARLRDCEVIASDQIGD
jgi:hypothetical protein